MLPFECHPGVYLIRCLVNEATYTGSSYDVRLRLHSHISTLRSGTSTANHLQRDWIAHGETAFVFYVRYRPVDELWFWEEQLTLLAHSLDDHGGYNKMLSNREWSISSRAKNTENKLLKKRKFCLLPWINPTGRLETPYIATFCQSTSPILLSKPSLQGSTDRNSAHAELMMELDGYERFGFQQKTKDCIH